MKWLETRRVQIKRLRLPGDVQRRRSAEHVAELAKSIGETGLINLPVVEAKTMRVIAGRDRVAALLEAGVKSVEVRPVEGTEQELRRLELSENLHRRRDDQDELRREYVAALGEELCDTLTQNSAPEPEPVRGRGRPRTPKGQVLAKAAEDLGVSVRTIQRAVEEPQQEMVPGVPALPKGFDDLGVELGFERVNLIVEATGYVDEIDKLLRKAQAYASSLEEMGKPYVGARIQRLQQDLHAAAVLARASVPKSTCPWCKAQLRKTGCNACGDTGYVLADQFDNVPPELLKTGAEAVIATPEGKVVPMSKSVQKRLKIQLVDDTGEELPF